ncbi:hypothetical protein HK104_002357 [Borealophlyctis nickersoniae]|nr:hypothetical protein HK104_002357 [Borealophlyctis nickersoniae]
MYTIADTIKDLPDDFKLLYHITEFKDDDLAFDYLCRLFTRLEKLIVEGRTEHGKKLALEYCAIAACNDDIQKVFRSVREVDEQASQK